MTRARPGLAVGIVLLAAAGTAALVFFFVAGGNARPDLRVPRANLVVFSIDTCRADHLSLSGYARPTTPALERIARDAIVFDNAVSGAPVTAPSHMTLFTGLPPTIHGVANFGRVARESRPDEVPALPPSMRTLAEMLRERGYRTGAFTGGGNVSAEFGFARGFDVYVGGNDSGTNGNRDVSFSARKPLEFVREAEAGSAPFFLFVHTYVPHSPYLPPSPYDTLYNPGYSGRLPRGRDQFLSSVGLGADYLQLNQRFWEMVDWESEEDLRQLVALYDGEIHASDDAVAQLFSGLEELEALSDTIVVVTSDHGEEFLEHGAFAHPGELWDELIRVPLVVLHPATRGRGFRVPDVVGGLDFVPTILDLLALPRDPQPIGRSVVPLLEGEEAPSDERFSVSEFVRYTVRDEKGVPAPAEYVRSVRTLRHKLIRRVGEASSTEIYDLGRDPLERENRAEDPSLRTVLQRLLAVSNGFDRLGEERRAAPAIARPSDETVKELSALGYVK